MRAWSIAIALAGGLSAMTPAAAPASAEVKSSAPDGMVLEFMGAIPLHREEAWKRVITPSAWWSDAHTYSGKASHMSLEAKAGGCWCETWANESGEDSSVEHGRVLTAMTNSTLRLSAPLGPLQAMGVHAVLSIELSDGSTSGVTLVTMRMNVAGSSLSGLDRMAAPVDGVLAEALGRLAAP